MHVATTERLNYGGQKSFKKIYKKIDDSNTSVILKQDQGYQIQYELVDTKQGSSSSSSSIP